MEQVDQPFGTLLAIIQRNFHVNKFYKRAGQHVADKFEGVRRDV